MAAISRKFAGAEPDTAPASERSPLVRTPINAVSLPLLFIATGILALFAGMTLLVARPDILATYHYNQYVIAATHLFVLGGICSVVMGAVYQLVPVALETKLYSERLARWQFVLHVAGIAGMVPMFWIWNMKQVGHFGSAFGFGVILFVYNLGRTLARIQRWNAMAFGVASSLFWLLMTMLAGLFLASAKCWPQINPFHPVAAMHAHAHLGVMGAFVTLIVGVSYKVVPMFALSEVRNNRRAMWSIALLNIGVPGLATTILLGSPWKLAFAFVGIGALAVYGVELRAILRARKRRRLDCYFLTAVASLVPLSAMAIVLCWPSLPATPFTAQLENVYGFVALFGVLTFAIVGMLYKIVPFLVWYHSYSGHVGRGKVPALADLYSPNLQSAGYWLFLTGFVATSIATASGNATAVQWSALLLAVALAVFGINMLRVFAHLVQPRVQPLALRPVAAGGNA